MKEADSVLLSTNITKEERVVYQTVMKNLMNFFNFGETLSLREQGSTDETSWK